MMRTNQVHEYVMESRWQRNRRIRRMWPDNMPVDKTWQLALFSGTLAVVNVILAVRWFLSV